MAVQDLEGYDEVVQRFLELLPPEKRLEGLRPADVMRSYAPEQRLEGLRPEQIVRTIGPEQVLPAMPDEILRALDPAFIEKLPEPTRSAIRKRLGR